MQTTDVSDLRSTIVPKSDQLNAEQLLGGPVVVTVADVRVGSGEEQPVTIHYEGDDGRPYKPCKTCRKVLILAWGPDGRQWIGRSMELYNDPAVRFGGMDVGGIRIAKLSDIERDVKVSLTATKGKKAAHTIGRLEVQPGPALADVLAAIDAASNKAEMDAAKQLAGALTRPADVEQAVGAYKARVAALKARAAAAPAPPVRDDPQPAGRSYAVLADAINTAADADAAALALDEGRHLPDDQRSDLAAAYNRKWSN